MKSKRFLFPFFIFLIFFLSIGVFGYSGNLYFANENVTKADNLLLNIKFSNGDSVNTVTDSNGKYDINENDIFCWTNCNLVPPITGESIIVRGDEISRIEYSTSNYRKSQDYHEDIFIASSLPKYEIQKDETTPGIPSSTIEDTYYYIEFNGTLNLGEYMADSALSLNAYWIEVSVGDYSTNLISENNSNHEFIFNLDKNFSNEKISIKYIFIPDGNTPNLRVYNLKTNQSSIITDRHIIFNNGFIQKIAQQKKGAYIKALSAIPEPQLPPYSMSSKCQRFNNNPQVSSYYPILLVHGLHGDQDDYWAYIPDKFIGKGFKTYQVQYTPANGDNRYNAYLLKLCIDAVKNDVSVTKVNLISHSMGGLVSRTYITGKGRQSNGNFLYYSGDVNRLVTIGSPLYGSYSANRLHDPSDSLRNWDFWKKVFTDWGNLGETYNEPAYIDLSVGSALTWNLKEAGLDNSVKYLTIAGTANDIVGLDSIHHESSNSDGVVSPSSASLRDFGIPLVLLYLNHNNERGQSAWPGQWCNGLLQLCDIEPMVNGISSFLKGNSEQTVKNDFGLASNEYYISSNSQVSDSIPSGFQNGMVLVRFVGINTPCSSCVKLRSGNIDFQLVPNIDTSIFTYWSGNPSYTGTTLPQGSYQVIVNGGNINHDVMIQSLQTNVYEIELDYDSDGIPDSSDSCPTIYGTYCHGCPQPNCATCRNQYCPPSGEPYCVVSPSSTLCNSNYLCSLGQGDNNYNIYYGEYSCQGYCDGFGNCDYANGCSYSLSCDPDDDNDKVCDPGKTAPVEICQGYDNCINVPGPLYNNGCPDTTPPDITIHSPLNGSIYTSPNVTINITPSEPAKFFINWFSNEGSYNITEEVNFTISYTIKDLEEGGHTLFVKAIDRSNNSANKTINFKVKIPICEDNDKDTYYRYDEYNCSAGNDCDDNNSNVHPGVPEICDNIVDDDCDGKIDDEDKECEELYLTKCGDYMGPPAILGVDQCVQYEKHVGCFYGELNASAYDPCYNSLCGNCSTPSECDVCEMDAKYICPRISEEDFCKINTPYRYNYSGAYDDCQIKSCSWVLQEGYCTIPTDGMEVIHNTTFCNGTYYLPNGITIEGDDIYLDCNDSVIYGNFLINSSNYATVRNCNVEGQIKNYLSYNSILKDSSILNSGLGLWNYEGASFKEISGNLFSNNSEGIATEPYGSTIGEVFSNVFVNNSRGISIYDTSANIYKNLFLDNYYGVRSVYAHINILSNNFSINKEAIKIINHKYSNISYNKLDSNEVGLSLEFINTPSENVILKSNNFNNNNLNIKNFDYTNISAEYNWWGTFVFYEINDSIYDYYDDNNFGIVYFDPWLCEPYPSNDTTSCRVPIACFNDSECGTEPFCADYVHYGWIYGSELILPYCENKGTIDAFCYNASFPYYDWHPPTHIGNDGDGDMWDIECDDCNDNDSNINPSLTEICDGKDNDCDKYIENVEIDSDGDSWFECNGDCWEGNPNMYPGAPQICDGLPNDCNNQTLPADEYDNDDDGYMGCQGDCNDTNPSINPTGIETCNNIDDDCDGTKDESLTRATTCGVGACAGNTGQETCSAGTWGSNTCNPLQGATSETCNNIDDDCDTQTDEGGNALCSDGLYCNGQEVCSGASGCQAGTPVNCNDGVNCTLDSCNEAQDECDHVTNDNLCPADTACGDYYCDAIQGCKANYVPPTTVCRASAGSCDIADKCTGSSAICPADNKSTAQCRASAGDCDLAESCDGTNNNCPADAKAPLSTPCDDGLWCSATDHCDGSGSCVQLTTRDCTANNIPAITTCDNNPDNIHFTYDLRSAFTSTCNEGTDSCTIGDSTITHTCDTNQCEAACDATHGCVDSTCSETYNDYCAANKLAEFDNDQVKDSTTVDDSCPNDCLDDCICTDCAVDCSAPATNTYCVKDVCGAECVVDADCGDGDSLTIDTCLDNCMCQYQSVQCINDNDCDDSNECTDDLCNLGTHTCEYLNNSNVCDDSLYCSVDDVCSEGNCGGSAKDCSANDIPGIATCYNVPDNISYTWDYFVGFVSECNEAEDKCTTGAVNLTHTCDKVECGAECVIEGDCPEKCTSSHKLYASVECNDCECDYSDYSCVVGKCDAECDEDTDCSCEQDYCNGTTLIDYPEHGLCGTSGAKGCLCQVSTSVEGECKPTLIPNAPECGECDDDNDCINLTKDYCNGTLVKHDKGKCINYNCEANTTTVEDCDNGFVCDGQETCLNAQCVNGTKVDCSQYNINGISTCFNDPDAINFTFDFRNSFISECTEPFWICTTGNLTITHSCDVGQCGAECDSIHECNNNSCFATYNDYCEDKRLVEYDSNKKLDSTIVEDSCQNSCENSCICTNCNVDCSPPQTNNYCVEDICGAECDENIDCEDTDCDYLDGCSGNDYHDYDDLPNSCLSNCECTENQCGAPRISYNDPRCVECLNDNNCTRLNTECADGVCNLQTYRCEQRFKPSTSVCRAASGDCDAEEKCTGSSTTCPSDTVRPNTYECRASAGVCDLAEKCDGSTENCPTNVFRPNTYVCRPSTGPGDVEEKCTGSNVTCPEDTFKPSCITIFQIIANYNVSQIQFNITLSKEFEYLKYVDLNDARPRNRTLCTNCDGYGYNRRRTKTLGDGYHTLIFYAINDDEVCEEEVSFFIDSTKPKVSKQEPQNRGYCNGFFNVKYTEEYLKNVYLYYGDSVVVLDNCSSGRNRECAFDVPITQYENKSIKFHFEVEDLFWKIPYRRNYTCLVDTIPPHITHLNWSISGSYLYLNISLDDKAEYLKYIDHNSRSGERSLCSGCNEYGASVVRRKYFSKGEHDVEIIAEDEAGNRDTKGGIKFTV